MCSDARRRFVIGFTIEDAIMTLWYCDRSQILLSNEFNFVQVSMCIHVQIRTHNAEVFRRTIARSFTSSLLSALRSHIS